MKINNTSIDRSELTERQFNTIIETLGKYHKISPIHDMQSFGKNSFTDVGFWFTHENKLKVMRLVEERE
jgi:hypothetical protein